MPRADILNLCCSIVAVHGFNGHRTETWGLGADDARAAEGQTWLETLLPTRIPEARVMTFGYDSGTIPGGLVSKTGVRDRAMDLLKALWNGRGSNKVGGRSPNPRFAKLRCF